MADDSCSVTWWGHASVEIRLDGIRLVTDPLLRRRVGPLHSSGHRPRPAEDDLSSVDAVLLSHLHHDHTDLPSIRRFGRTTTTIAPVGAGSLLRRHARGPVLELPIGSETRIGGVRVAATLANHDGRRHGGHAADAVGYLVRGSRSIYFAGDTDVFPSMAAIADDPEGRLDVALLPVSGLGTHARGRPHGSGRSGPTPLSCSGLVSPCPCTGGRCGSRSPGDCGGSTCSESRSASRR